MEKNILYGRLTLLLVKFIKENTRIIKKKLE